MKLWLWTALLCTSACASPVTPTPVAPRPVLTPVYVVIGDSIAMGQTDTPYRIPDTLDATVFRKDHQWTRLNDPTDLWSNVGSFWPLVAPSLPAPSKWVTVAQGGTTLHADWQPGHVSFNALEQFVGESGVDHVTAFLCHLGANDVMWPDTLSTDQVFADLTTFAHALSTRWPGSVLYLADLGDVQTGHPPDREAAHAHIRAAFERAWTELPTVRRGPALRDLTPDDGVHFRRAETVQTIARRWVDVLTH